MQAPIGVIGNDVKPLTYVVALPSMLGGLELSLGTRGRDAEESARSIAAAHAPLLTR